MNSGRRSVEPEMKMAALSGAAIFVFVPCVS
jgi:hypothetical protein